MKTDVTTEQIALYYCNIINREFQEKKYKNDWFFDFKIMKDSLPDNFNPNDFLKVIQDAFNISDIKIDDLEYKLRVIGRVKLEQ